MGGEDFKQSVTNAALIGGAIFIGGWIAAGEITKGVIIKFSIGRRNQTWSRLSGS